MKSKNATDNEFLCPIAGGDTAVYNFLKTHLELYIPNSILQKD
jgi:hypothetical protein